MSAILLFIESIENEEKKEVGRSCKCSYVEDTLKLCIIKQALSFLV